MQVIRHADPLAFLQRAEPFLTRAEAENNLLLSIPATAAAGATHGPNAYFATVEQSGEVVGCAIRTPPNKAVISRGGSEAIASIVDDLMDAYADLPAVFGPDPAARQFGELWSKRTGVPPQVGMRQRLFEARSVLPLARRPRGFIRIATESDLHLITPWVTSFVNEVRLEHQPDLGAMARQRISAGSMFVWDDGGPVSMAAWAGRTAHGVRVNFVYTPPENRGRGYASACVADLTAQLLNQGAEFCCLVTDLANPTSNSIYQRIGYRSVCDVTDVILVPSVEKPHRR